MSKLLIEDVNPVISVHFDKSRVFNLGSFLRDFPKKGNHRVVSPHRRIFPWKNISCRKCPETTNVVQSIGMSLSLFSKDLKELSKDISTVYSLLFCIVNKFFVTFRWKLRYTTMRKMCCISTKYTLILLASLMPWSSPSPLPWSSGYMRNDRGLPPLPCEHIRWHSSGTSLVP